MNINTWYCIAQEYMGNYGGNDAYVKTYVKFTHQEIENNRSFVEAQCNFYVTQFYVNSYKPTGGSISCTALPYSASGDNGGSYSGETPIAHTEGWISHNNDGSKNIIASANMYTAYNSANKTATGSISLPKIPRQANLISAPNFNDEENPKITYSNPLGSTATSLQACLSFDGSGDDILYRDIPKNGTEYTFNFTNEERQILRNYCNNANSKKIMFFVKTVIGNSIFGSSLNKTLTITNANPTFEDYNYSISDNLTQILTGSTNKLIKGISKIKINNLICEPKKNAELKLIQIGSNQYSYVDNFEKEIDKWEDNIINVYVIDSRNNSTKIEKLIGINYIDYKKPFLKEMSILRDNSINEESKLKFSGEWDNINFGDVSNSLSIMYQYKLTSSDEWTNGQSTLNIVIDNNNFSFEGYVKGDLNNGFNADKSYNIKLIITDSCTQNDAIIYYLNLAIGEPAIDIYKHFVSFGGSFDETKQIYQAQFKKDVNFESKAYIKESIINSEKLIWSGIAKSNQTKTINTDYKLSNYRKLKVLCCLYSNKNQTPLNTGGANTILEVDLSSADAGYCIAGIVIPYINGNGGKENSNFFANIRFDIQNNSFIAYLGVGNEIADSNFYSIRKIWAIE